MSYTLSVSPVFVPTVNKFVGDALTSVYTMYNPTSNRAWCDIIIDHIVTTSNAAWSGTEKLTYASGSPTATVFNLY